MAEGFIQRPVTTFFVSGIWKDSEGLPSHYAVHQLLDPGVTGSRKYSKSELIKILQNPSKTVYVWGWDYRSANFRTGQKVILADTPKGKVIWTDSRSENTKHLKHLINYNWMVE